MTSANTSKYPLQSTVITDKENGLPLVSTILVSQLTYKMQYVLASLLWVMVAKRMLSIDDAKKALWQVVNHIPISHIEWYRRYADVQWR
jgi:hypothetical protein